MQIKRHVLEPIAPALAYGPYYTGTAHNDACFAVNKGTTLKYTSTHTTHLVTQGLTTIKLWAAAALMEIKYAMLSQVKIIIP